MEAMMSEFDYFTPSVIQAAIVKEYEEMISPAMNLNSDAANPLSTIEFKVNAASNLYRDLNNSYVMLTMKMLGEGGADLASNAAVAPTNLTLHSLFSNVSVTLCGKELSEKDSMYAYRAYLETLLSHSPDTLRNRFQLEGWAKDDAGKMDSILLTESGGKHPNSGFVERQKLVAGSRTFTLCGRLHADLFHQPLDIPPNCELTVTMTPSAPEFSIMEAAAGKSKYVLMDAKLFIRTKQVCPELIVAHREMLEKSNMRFPYNRVTLKKDAIAKGTSSKDIVVHFASKLPKRIFLAFVENSALTGVRNQNPFNFKNMGLKSISVNVNGVSIPPNALRTNFAQKDVQRAYMHTMGALGLDQGDRSIDLTPTDFVDGYAIYGFKIAPGPIDNTVHSATENSGGINVSVIFDPALPEAVDMIVFAETPAVLEIDKLNTVTLL